MAEQRTKIKRPGLQQSLAELTAFLGCATPHTWIDRAITEVEILLIDHANCERKAATTALALVARYTRHTQLLLPLSHLAREELHHFEQVVKIMDSRQVAYRPLSASRYAGGLHALVRRDEPGHLIDLLIIGAFIEARSCERFAAVAPHLDPELARFYRQLLRSEARHYRTYLDFAEQLDATDVAARVPLFREAENALITTPDPLFRFHSGAPQTSGALVD